MKLAEALAERAEATRRYDQLLKRIHRSVRVQEGDQPAEDPIDLLREANAILDRIDLFIRRINKTNIATQFDEHSSLTDAIAHRDILNQRRRLYADAASRAGTTQERYTRNEVKFVAAVDVRALQHEHDRLADQYRALDTALQRLNWTSDLL